MLRKTLCLFVFVVIGLAAFTACHSTMLGLDKVDTDFANKPAAYPLLNNFTVETWPEERDRIKALFEDKMYGPWPSGINITIERKSLISPDFFGGQLEEWVLDVGEVNFKRRVHMAIAFPPESKGPVPFVSSLSFGSNCSAFPHQPLTDKAGKMCDGDRMNSLGGKIVKRLFGEYIAHVPIERYFSQGIGYANVFASEFIPDNAVSAPEVMKNLTKSGTPPTGALMGWAFLQSEMASLLAEDPRVDGERIASFGHSRFGKASLISAAWSPNISAAVSLQSGFGGAALSRSETGETLKRMIEGPSLLGGLVKMDGYPHWLSPNVLDWADAPEEISFDQHMLLALIAPKPILLTNGRKDVWSDPNSTFRAAIGASPIYELYSGTGLKAKKLTEFRPNDDIAFTLTKDGHGIRQDDVDAILSFLGVVFN